MSVRFWRRWAFWTACWYVLAVASLIVNVFILWHSIDPLRVAIVVGLAFELGFGVSGRIHQFASWVDRVLS
ncbi:MAG TPA: hypothetical protein VFU63_00175 [Ktedonobacterales bacterium]|nr:hypothetical protein [Ktedonobacterales bacterium]